MLWAYLTRLCFGLHTTAFLTAPLATSPLHLAPELGPLVQTLPQSTTFVEGLVRCASSLQALLEWKPRRTRDYENSPADGRELGSCAREATTRGPGCEGRMLPFPYQQTGRQGLFYMNGNQMYGNQMNNNQMYMPQQQQQQRVQMYMPGPQAQMGMLMNSYMQFRGNSPRGNMGQYGGRNNQFSPGRNHPRQQYPQSHSGRNRNNLKRKSSDYDFNAGKMGRYEGQRFEPLNSSKSSFNSSGSTSMHMSLVNGAKPILHVPGQPCERITEAIVQYYNDFHQSAEDLKHKIVLSNCLYAIVKGIFPGCRLFIVGSSLSGFGTHTSDMDLCLLVTQIQEIDQKNEAVHILNAIHKSLRKCTFIKSSQVIKAKVPILKFTDSKKNIECDLNINNGVGIRNTHLLKHYCLADARVAPLMLFVKFWARFHDINDAHKKTISSYSLALMLIHYLQVCTPPVLPCLQKIYPERFDEDVDLRELRLDQPLHDLVSKNTDSLGKLFQGFLDYYAYTFRPHSEVISIREGCVLNRQEVEMSRPEPRQWKCLCIEEPFDMTNTARSVFDPYIFERISQVFWRSADMLRQQGDVSVLLRQPF